MDLNKSIKQAFECPYASIGCDDHIDQQNDSLNHARLLIEMLHNVKNDVDTNKSEILSLKQDNRNKDNKIATLEADSNSKENKILRLQEELRLKDMVDEQRIEILNLKVTFNEQKNKIATLEADSNSKENKIVALQNELRLKDRLMTQMVGEQKTEIINLKVTFNEQKNKMDAFTRESVDQKKVTIVDRSLDNALNRINDLETKLEKLDNGTNKKVAVGFTAFSVDNFQIMKVPGEGILSPCFYSHTNGYKLRLQIYPGGYLEGADTHLSLYIVICKGEYDDILPWPCKHPIKVSIINQLNGDTHYSGTWDYWSANDNSRYAFFKPTVADNTAYGQAMFISHDDLNTTKGLIVDDSVVIRCVINIPI